MPGRAAGDDDQQQRRRHDPGDAPTAQADPSRRFRRRRRPVVVQFHSIGADRSRNILDVAVAEIVEAEAQLVAHLVADHPRHQNAAGFRQTLQPRRDIDPVAIDVVAVHDHVADIDTDPEIDPRLRGNVGVSLQHAALDFDYTAHCVHDRGELDQHAIPGGLDDATAVLGDLGIDQRLAVAFEPRERAFLVGGHQPRVARDVRRHDRRQLPLDPLRGHWDPRRRHTPSYHGRPAGRRNSVGFARGPVVEKRVL